MAENKQTVAKVEATQSNEIKLHELKDDLRIFTIVEMIRNEKDERTEKETETHKFHVALGNQLITDAFDTKRDAINFLKTKPYQIILAMVTKYIETLKIYNNEIK